MTNVANIATQTVKTSPNAAQGQGPALSGAQNGVFGATSGLNFMDMIFALTTTTTTTKPVTTPTTTDGPVLKAPVTVHPAFTANTQTITAAQLALTTQIAAPGINTAPGPVVTPDIHAEAGINIDELNALLVALTDPQANLEGYKTFETPEQSGETADGLTVTTASVSPIPLSDAQRLEMIKIIQSLLQGLPAQNIVDGADPALIATSLTPATLNNLVKQLQKDGDVAATMENIVNITGAESADYAAIATPLLPVPASETTLAANADLGARPAGFTPTGADSFMPQPGAPTAPAPGTAGYVPNAAVNGNAAPNNNGAGGSSFNAAASQKVDGLLNSAGWDSIYPDGLDWTQSGVAGTPGLNLTGPSQFASLVAHANSAATPHPATQVVAATLTKAAADGETKSLTLKLDPPELGRIEIRMDFGKEKGMKAHIVMEKAETYMMMQRDSHVLERALQNAGLDTTDGGISFELSQDGNLFSDGHEGQNRHAGGSGGSADGETGEDILIETTMNWSVDADGNTRYDILA